jgi:hypothetical protein
MPPSDVNQAGLASINDLPAIAASLTAAWDARSSPRSPYFVILTVLQLHELFSFDASDMTLDATLFAEQGCVK